jgi:hypothetical protein
MRMNANAAHAQGLENMRNVFGSNAKTPRENRMEHRWGRRRPCRAIVWLSASGGITGAGRLRDVSMSGAFLETALSLPLFAQLAMAVLRDDGSKHPLEFTGVVVRRDEDGVGIEWCDPDSVSICRALDCGIDCARAATGT